MPDLYVHHDAALPPGGGGGPWQGRVGAGSPQSRRPARGGHAAAKRLGKLRRRRTVAHASRADARRAGIVVRRHPQARRRVSRDRNGRLAARRGAGVRLAARRADLDQSQSQRAEPLDGAGLRRHGDGRGHDAVGGPRHHPAAGGVRRSRHRRRARPRGHAGACARLAGWLPAARMLVRTDVP